MIIVYFDPHLPNPFLLFFEPRVPNPFLFFYELLISIFKFVVAKTFILKKAPLLVVLERFFLNFLFHGEERFELLHDLATSVFTDLKLVLAVRAGHESEKLLQRGPLLLQLLHDAVCVEDMAAGKLGAVLSAELLRVADLAQFVLVFTLVDTRCLCVFGFLAWCAFGFGLFNFFGEIH